MGHGDRTDGTRNARAARDTRNERDTRDTRRRFLRGVGLLAAAGAAAAVRADKADAATGDALICGAYQNTCDSQTALTVTGTTAGYGFGVFDNVAPTILGHPAVMAHAKASNFNQAIQVVAEGASDGVTVSAASGTGMSSVNNSAQPALYAFNFGGGPSTKTEAQYGGAALVANGKDTSAAIVATGTDAGGGSATVVQVTQNGDLDGVSITIPSPGGGDAIRVVHQGAGRGLNVDCQSASNASDAAVIRNAGSGRGLVVTNASAPSTAAAIAATATKGAGIKASGKIGAQLSGTTTPLRLTKGGALPATGTPGDFFVDQNSHLYFHNANGWVLLA